MEGHSCHKYVEGDGSLVGKLICGLIIREVLIWLGFNFTGTIVTMFIYKSRYSKNLF